MLDIQKQYGIAESMVGGMAKDLVHICYEKIAPRLDTIEHPNTYFFRIMRNEVKSGRWKEHTTGAPKSSKMYHLNGDDDWHEEQKVIHEPSPFFEYDPIKMQKIIQQIEAEGFREEVQLFKRHASGDSITQLNIDTNVCRRLIKECINFVKQSVIERYGDHHS